MCVSFLDHANKLSSHTDRTNIKNRLKSQMHGMRCMINRLLSKKMLTKMQTIQNVPVVQTMNTP